MPFDPSQSLFTGEEELPKPDESRVRSDVRRTPHPLVLMALSDTSDLPQAQSRGRSVSHGSASTVVPERLIETGSGQTVQSQEHKEDISDMYERRTKQCTLWVHDDNFSKADMILNTSIFPEGTFQSGDLAEIVALPADAVGRRPLGGAAKEKIVFDGHDSKGSSRPFMAGGKDGKHGTGVEDASERDPGRERSLRRSYLFLVQDMDSDQRARQPNLQISLASHIASLFGFRNWMQVLVSVVDKDVNAASHVELVFKDEFLARSDLWRLVISELSRKTVYKGQKIIFIGSIKAQVKNVYVREKKVSSAYFSTNSVPIFRSQSARQVLLLQMSKEMCEFDSDGSGEIMFDKVINGFLPELSRRWVKIRARHLISIVLFARVRYDNHNRDEDSGGPVGASGKSGFHHRDYYRVVVSEIESTQWATILHQLKKEFKVFWRDVSIDRPLPPNGSMLGEISNEATKLPPPLVLGKPSSSIHGNVLEAICLASSQFSMGHIDCDLVRTGSSIVIVTPGSGLFEVEYDMLKLTTEILTSNGFGVDLICLSRMPLHSVPLVKYRNPSTMAKPEPDLLTKDNSGISTPRQKYPEFGSYSSQHSNPSPSKFLEYDSRLRKISTLKPGPGEWVHAIPTWMDVSYWTGSSNIKKRQVEDDEFFGLAAPMYRPDSAGFIPRANMYELQMMGIMENEMSNISLPYLNQGAFMSPYSEQSFPKHERGQQGMTNKQQASGDSTPTNLDTQRPEPDVSSAFAKVGRDRPSTKEDKGAFKWMDDYDDQVFCSVAQLRAAEEKVKLRTKEANKLKALEDDALIFGTSFNDAGRSADRTHPASGTAYFDRKMKERVRSAAGRSQNDGTKKGPKLHMPVLSYIPPQLGSGFGARNMAALKSVASTELSAEHVTSASAVGRVWQQPIADSSSSRTSISSPLASTSRLNVPGKAEAADRETEQSRNPIEDTPSRPIAIKKPMATPERLNTRNVDIISDYTGHIKIKKGPEKMDALQAASIVKQAGPKVDQAPSAPELVQTLSPTSALAPWLALVNPSNPRKDQASSQVKLTKWQHLFPDPNQATSVKWNSLCSPTVFPLTTDQFPTADQLSSEYHENPYGLSQNEDEDVGEAVRSKDELLRELISLRLAQGFQFVVGPAAAEALGRPLSKAIDIFDDNQIVEEGAVIVMSLGNSIHQLQRVGGGEVEIKRYVRKPTTALATSPFNDPGSSMYRMRIRTSLAENYEERQLRLRSPREEYNWNYADSFIAGYTDSFTEQLRFWCARFVLIPVEQPIAVRNSSHMSSEDNEEEIRLEGIRKLTQMWQRFRYVSPEERRYLGKARQERDINPLDIVYQTRDPSAVVAAELDSMALIDTEPGQRRSNLFASEEAFQRANLNLATLAQEIQGDKGVPMQDRRWHWRLHYNCFIGFEMTTWLLENFRDVQSREEAVELGNELMKKGFFQHVERRHQFRDGNFFYQLGGEYRNARPESKRGWFGSRRTDKSVPSTPASDVSKDSPQTERSRSALKSEGTLPEPEAGGFNSVSVKKLKVTLSKVMRYDVDHRRRSYRPELINLHYDRLHNPDNCYHLRIDWMNVTAKLIEDAIVTWATTAERFGLKLVEVPIREASSITETHPLRSPFYVRLARAPPPQQPQEFFDAESLGPRIKTDPFFYHKALLKKFGFVLDMEAAKNFPADVEVTYSWGQPDYRYTQYVHRSGALLAQITDDGDLLLLENRLCGHRGAAGAERFDKADVRDRRSGHYRSPFTSPLVRAMADAGDVVWMGPEPSPAPVTPEDIKNEVEGFCKDPDALQTFYDAIFSDGMSVAPEAPMLDSSIPSLGLPPSAVPREALRTSPGGTSDTATTEPAHASMSHPDLADTSADEQTSP